MNNSAQTHEQQHWLDSKGGAMKMFSVCGIKINLWTAFFSQWVENKLPGLEAQPL